MVQGCVKTWSKIYSSFPSLRCFLAIVKSPIVCRGARIIFAGCWGVKKEFLKNAFLFLPFHVGEKEKMNLDKENFKKKQKIVLLGGCERFLWAKMVFEEK